MECKMTGVLWDDSEASGEVASSAENESATEGSLDERKVRKVHIAKMLNFHLILEYFPSLFIINVF
jgi:hypothetical protein